MAITLRASTDALFTTQTSFSITTPSSAFLGDIIIVQVYSIGSNIDFFLNTPSMTGVSDWVIQDTQQDGNLNMGLYTGKVTGPVIGGTLTFSLEAGSPTHSYIIYNDFENMTGTMLNATGNLGDSTSIAIPNLTSVVSGNLMMFMAISNGFINSITNNEGFGAARSYTTSGGPSFISLTYIAPHSGSFPMPTASLSAVAPWFATAFQVN